MYFFLQNNTGYSLFNKLLDLFFMLNDYLHVLYYCNICSFPHNASGPQTNFLKKRIKHFDAYYFFVRVIRDKERHNLLKKCLIVLSATNKINHKMIKMK